MTRLILRRLALLVPTLLGLSVLLLSSALAFSIVKYAGAAYLVWLGLRKIFGPAENGGTNGELPRYSHARLFRDGFVVNLLNPKTALFFFAFLPQFVDPNGAAVPLQILLLGLIFMALALCTDSLYAWTAGTAARWIRGNRQFQRVQRYVTGAVFIGLGLSMALTGSRSK